MQSENELDKKRIVERFETELTSKEEFFKKQVADVRNDFQEDIRSMQKLRARDKTDMENRSTEHWGYIKKAQDDKIKYQNWFSTIAQAISMMTENINM